MSKMVKKNENNSMAVLNGICDLDLRQPSSFHDEDEDRLNSHMTL